MGLREIIQPGVPGFPGAMQRCCRQLSCEDGELLEIPSTPIHNMRRGNRKAFLRRQIRRTPMSKMACVCGGVISNSLCPCPTEGWLLRDQDQEDFYDGTSRDIAAFFAAVQSGCRDAWIAEYFSSQTLTSQSDEVIIYDIIAHHKRQVVLFVAECGECGRLWVQRGPEINEYRSYSPDKPGYAGALRSKAVEPAMPSTEAD